MNFAPPKGIDLNRAIAELLEPNPSPVVSVPRNGSKDSATCPSKLGYWYGTWSGYEDPKLEPNDFIHKKTVMLLERMITKYGYSQAFADVANAIDRINPVTDREQDAKVFRQAVAECFYIDLLAEKTGIDEPMV